MPGKRTHCSFVRLQLTLTTSAVNTLPLQPSAADMHTQVLFFLGSLFFIIGRNRSSTVPNTGPDFNSPCGSSGTVCFLGAILLFFKLLMIWVLVEMFAFPIFWVRSCVTVAGSQTTQPVLTQSLSSRDFFPVTLTSSRPLPFIRQLLNLPFICSVRPPPLFTWLCHNYPQWLRSRVSAFSQAPRTTEMFAIIYHLALSDVEDYETTIELKNQHFSVWFYTLTRRDLLGSSQMSRQPISACLGGCCHRDSRRI